MSKEFLQPSEELKRLAEGISGLRRDLQTTTSSLSRIERRLKAAFPNYPAKKKATKSPKAVPSTNKSNEELNKIFDSLVVATKEEGDAGFDRAASSLEESVILAVAVEVGAGATSRLTVPKAKRGIRRRVQESLQLRF